MSLFYCVTNNIVVSNIDENLTCTDHEEADTKIIHHIYNIDAQTNFDIRCSDTAAIMLGNMQEDTNDADEDKKDSSISTLD
ncbi:uncharacterized protein TNIN_236611 [Trichonephila inaurata madagascariensis]|uniref:Uncharacterized protein n=1 Tax=Trichonephila inaurata madagascariensis TaxID=2747483 RepID=A0A8X6YY99_9ARAC|nr:uncharacterized protein TNIN_236611 [Trichonephila inaurata madagascariensis]